MRCFLTSLIFAGAMSFSGPSSLKLHALFADGAVFQTTDDGGEGSSITGTAAPHERVTLSSDKPKEWPSHSITADVAGHFSFPIKLPSGGPFVLTVSAGSGSKSASDVYVGDVFLCSGQSNMVFPIGSGNDYWHGKGGQTIENATREMAAADHPNSAPRPALAPSHLTPPSAALSRGSRQCASGLCRRPRTSTSTRTRHSPT